MLTTVNPKEPERGPVDPDPEVPGPRHPDPNFPQPGDPPKLPTPVTDPPPSEPQPKPFVPLSPEMSCEMKEEAKANLPATQSADWSEHEHVSTQVQLQAEKLVGWWALLNLQNTLSESWNKEGNVRLQENLNRQHRLAGVDHKLSDLECSQWYSQ